MIRPQILLAAPLLAAVLACQPEAATTAVPEAAVAHALGSHVDGDISSPEVQKWLAGLRAALAPIRDFEAAKVAGWDEKITPCMTKAGAGGMGFHYGNPGLINGTVDEFAPELLLFEPQKNGQMRLVAVEYIVPFSERSDTGPAPTLHGLAFHQNYDFGVWVLHAWIWKNNPSGIFKDWNPTVTCDFAP